MPDRPDGASMLTAWGTQSRIWKGCLFDVHPSGATDIPGRRLVADVPVPLRTGVWQTVELEV